MSRINDGPAQRAGGISGFSQGDALQGPLAGLALRPLLLIAFAFAAVQVLSLMSPHYGTYIDEFYYDACARRLAWGYVDHPPFSIFVLRLVRASFGDSLFAMRAIAALCGDAVTARAAREWTDANVLCLSNRTLSPDLAREILAAWFDAGPLPGAAAGIGRLRQLDGQEDA